MLRLDTTTRSLQITLGTIVTTSQLPVMVSYGDKTSTNFNGSSQMSNTNNTSVVTICSAPAASTVRNIDYVSVRNADTAAATVTITLNDNATLYNIVSVSLAVGDELTFTHSNGWQVITSGGYTKAISSTNTSTATNIFGGAANQIPYQTGSSATSFITAPSVSTTYLQWTGSAFTWATVSAGGSITLNNDVATNATYYPVFSTVIGSGTTASALDTSSTKLTYNPSTGTLSATVFTSLSDVTMKTNITPVLNATDIVNKLTGVKFNWIDTGKPSVGLIAQEVEMVLPELVNTDAGNIKHMNYDGIVGVLVEAVKQLTARISVLESK